MGPGDVLVTSICEARHFVLFSMLLRNAKTSSMGRSITRLTCTWLTRLPPTWPREGRLGTVSHAMRPGVRFSGSGARDARVPLGT